MDDPLAHAFSEPASTDQDVIAALDTQVRILSDPVQMLQMLVTTIGRHLGVDRCFLTEVVDIDADSHSRLEPPHIAVRALWIAGNPFEADAVSQHAPILSQHFAADLRLGRIVALEDLRRLEPASVAMESATLLNVRSIVIVPYLRSGRWVAGMTVHCSQPRRWSDRELSIIEAAVKRTWPLVERSRAVEALAESENRLRHAAEAANFSSFDLDPSSGEGFWSPEINRVLRRREPLSVPISFASIAALVHPDDRQRFADLIASFASSGAGAVVIGEFRHLTDDGEVCWFLLRGRAQFSGSGEHRAIKRIRGVMMDITPRKRDEEERLAALDAAAHDLKNPVATIRALAQVGMRLQQRSGDANPQLLDILESIETATDRLTSVIGDLLDTAHLRAGRSLPLNRRSLDIVAMLRSSVAAWREAHPDRDLIEAYDVASLVGCWDEQRLNRAVDNLIGNAIKFSPAGGPVTISLTAEDDTQPSIAITIADQGIGIAAHDLARVQGTFQRGSNVPESIPGTGVGLMAARLIVEQHGGALRLESTEGVGTTVNVRLPVEPCPG